MSDSMLQVILGAESRKQVHRTWWIQTAGMSTWNIISSHIEMMNTDRKIHIMMVSSSRIKESTSY